MNTAISIFLIIIAILTFSFFIDPKYNDIKILQEDKSRFVEKDKKRNEIEKKKRTLQGEYTAIPTSSLARLEKLLPNRMDNVELIVDIQRIAFFEDNIRISNIFLDRERLNAASKTSEGLDFSAPKEYEAVNLSFSFVTKYENFKSFMEKLRKSLRLVDIVSVNFSQESRGEEASGNYQFDVVIRTYWLKK